MCNLIIDLRIRGKREIVGRVIEQSPDITSKEEEDFSLILINRNSVCIKTSCCPSLKYDNKKTTLYIIGSMPRFDNRWVQCEFPSTKIRNKVYATILENVKYINEPFADTEYSVSFENLYSKKNTIFNISNDSWIKKALTSKVKQN